MPSIGKCAAFIQGYLLMTKKQPSQTSLTHCWLALIRYHTENRNLLYGDFKFGPLFMRLCYELGLESMAFATITDKVNCVTSKFKLKNNN